jgi:hypothetical protein
MERQSPPDGEQFSGAPNPEALLPKLDEHQLELLRHVGHEWDRVCGDAALRRRALPVDPNLGSYPAEIHPTRFGRFVPVAGQDGQLPALEATSRAEQPETLPGHLAYRLRRVLIGPPLSASAIARERMRKLVALPVLSADALSSVAYGPEAMLAILVLAGSGGLGYSLPIAATIAFLMLAVGVSYRQTIRAYPHGGGSYIVATDNLGRMAGLTAAAGLMTDYILTVAVSVASGHRANRRWRDPLAARGQPTRRAPGGPDVRRANVCVHHRDLRTRRRRRDRRGRSGVSPHPNTAARRHRGGRGAASTAGLRLGIDGDDWDRGDLKCGAGVPAARVAQRPRHPDLDDQPADHHVRRHRCARPSRRGRPQRP